eukprot:12517056-Ditylum_brightwellii.AAC.1
MIATCALQTSNDPKYLAKANRAASGSDVMVSSVAWNHMILLLAVESTCCLEAPCNPFSKSHGIRALAVFDSVSSQASMCVPASLQILAM